MRKWYEYLFHEVQLSERYKVSQTGTLKCESTPSPVALTQSLAWDHLDWFYVF